MIYTILKNIHKNINMTWMEIESTKMPQSEMKITIFEMATTVDEINNTRECRTRDQL